MNLGDYLVNLLPDELALFSDFDGTLVELCDRPDQVRLESRFNETLQRLMKRLPAMAIVSGRSISQVDQLLATDDYSVAGLHGAEIRVTKKIICEQQHTRIPQEVNQLLDERLGSLSRMVVEHKGYGIALHYREHPELADQLQALALLISERYPEFVVIAGKCVYELKQRNVDKGQAIDFLLSHDPFKGRIPVFIGDDTTDEDGFDTVNRRGGISIKVGPEPTTAQYRLKDVAEVHALLDELSAAL